MVAMRLPHKRVIQVVAANAGWWASFGEAGRLAVASWALVEDCDGEPIRYLSAYLEGEGIFLAHDLMNFETFDYEP